MINLIYKIHWAIIGYAIWNLYNVYEEKDRVLTEEKSRIPVMEMQIKKKEKELKKLLAYQSQIEEKKKELELAAGEIEKLQKKFPSEVNDPENLAIIKDESDGINIKNPDLSSLKEENKGFYFIKRYKYEASATFLQLLILFEKISENERLFNINEVRIKSSGQKQRGRFQVVDGEFIVEAYRYNSSYRSDLEAEMENKKGGNTNKRGRNNRAKKKSKK